MGRYLFESLQSLRKHRTVGEIRGGLGLDCHVQFIKNNKTEEEFSQEENAKFVALLKKELREAGLWELVGNPLELKPALIITKDKVNEIANRLDMAMNKVEAKIATG
jgi:adenosylmethionine-8-amino-7-oxononanoate aminotransferase